MPETWHDGFLAALEDTRNVREACRQVGVGKSTVYRSRKADEQFAARFAEVESVLVDEAADELRRLGFEGTKDDSARIRALEIFLKAHRPELYSDRHRVEHSGSVASPTVDVTTMTDEELRAIVAEAERATADAAGPDEG